ncbi:hypothetical protein A3709_13010 [Halioglobus sp. HI00S01]|uniref:CsiV family protein n=1 Tax=Halioglobus sp. HI00S01 TaxID=1822214 RepID=UPI0007C40BDC|nr:CsiV family protein [Halioglobus sp. HI00S01]KZX60208.1 hypothetical protein A3709_13010 [Halioglobus sp. HI00S01]
MPLARHLLYPTALSLCLLSAAAQANERWYQVELMVFANETGSASEQWEPLPQLNYPSSSRFLVYPAQVEARLAEHPGASNIDAYGRQLIVMSALEESTNIPPLPSPDTAAPETALEPAVTEPDQDPLEPQQLYPTPFIALPHAQREFHGKSAYMQRTGKYRTLFHETWVQPVQPEATAIPLVLDSSGDIQDWPRLQGTVTLHIARYLHVETNLWLNTRGDYLPGEWRMPAPPLGPPSLVVEQPEPNMVEAPEPYYVNQVPADHSVWPGDPNAIPDLEQDMGPVYPWRHAVAFKQKRRMRSNEVHYLDHPLVGLVVKFTPLDEEQLHEMGLAEQRSDADTIAGLD